MHRQKRIYKCECFPQRKTLRAFQIRTKNVFTLRKIKRVIKFDWIKLSHMRPSSNRNASHRSKKRNDFFPFWQTQDMFFFLIIQMFKMVLLFVSRLFRFLHLLPYLRIASYKLRVFFHRFLYVNIYILISHLNRNLV